MNLGGFGGVRQFSLEGVDLGHCVDGFWGVRQFSFVEGLFGALCGWF